MWTNCHDTLVGEGSGGRQWPQFARTSNINHVCDKFRYQVLKDIWGGGRYRGQAVTSKIDFDRWVHPQP